MNMKISNKHNILSYHSIHRISTKKLTKFFKPLQLKIWWIEIKGRAKINNNVKLNS